MGAPGGNLVLFERPDWISMAIHATVSFDPDYFSQKVVDGAFAKRTTFGQSSWLCGLFLGLLALLDSIREDDSLDYLVKELVTLQATPMFLRAHQ
jgi:hypothetical protein